LTLVTGPRRSLRLKLSDTRVYAPHIRARHGTTAHFCRVVVLKLIYEPQMRARWQMYAGWLQLLETRHAERECSRIKTSLGCCPTPYILYPTLYIPSQFMYIYIHIYIFVYIYIYICTYVRILRKVVGTRHAERECSRIKISLGSLHHSPHTLHPTPHTLHPTPYTLHPSPYTLHPDPLGQRSRFTWNSTCKATPLALAGNPTPYTLHPTPYTVHPTPHTLHPTPYTPHPTVAELEPNPLGCRQAGVEVHGDVPVHSAEWPTAPELDPDPLGSKGS